jgi:hypothetical protein
MHHPLSRRLHGRTICLLVACAMVSSCGARVFIARPSPAALLGRSATFPSSLEFFHAPSEGLLDSIGVSRGYQAERHPLRAGQQPSREP